MRTPHPTNHTRPLRQIEHAAELLTLATTLIPDVWQRICDGINGQPSAQQTDSDGGSSSILDDRGVPMPRLSDPTGEASTRPDPCRRDLEELRRLAKKLHADAERTIAILASHQARPADGYQRMSTADNDPGCTSCARLETHGAPRWEPIHHHITVNDERIPVCQWCGRWHKDTGTLPSRKILADHHDGKRIKRPA